MDRRRVRDRVARLDRDLSKLHRQREGRRAYRTRRGLPVLSIVGYTNAGKSTLLRALTKKEVHIEDKMFATLDPASRRLRFPRDREVIVTDTVGFIRELPRDLMVAFHATLQELREADLFLHVVDASGEDVKRRMAAVRKVLDEIDLGETKELLVFNKVDLLPPGQGASLAELHGAVAVSALERTGLRELLERAEQELWREDGSGARIAAGGAAGRGWEMEMTLRAKITGTGMYVPERVVTNKDLEEVMDTSDEWIRQRSGIEERHWVSEGQGPVDLAEPAARRALADAGLEADDLDCIILATLSPQHVFPGTSFFLQDRLGGEMPCFDLARPVHRLPVLAQRGPELCALWAVPAGPGGGL